MFGLIHRTGPRAEHIGTLRGLVLPSVGRGFYTGNTERTATDFLGAGKEAGEIEFDARGLLFLDTDPCPIDGEAPARLHIAKHTFGAEGTTIGLRFRGALGVFADDPMAALTDEQRAALEAIRDGATSIKAVATEIERRESDTRAIVQMLVARGVVDPPRNKCPLRVREGV